MPFLDLYIFKHGHWAISWGGIMILSDLMSHLPLFYSCKCWPTFSLRTSLILCACSLNLDRLSSSSRQRPCQATFNGMFEWKHFIELCFKDETSSKVPEALPASSVNQVAETLEQVNIIGASVVGAWYFLLYMRHLVKGGGFHHYHPDHHHQPPCQRGSGLLQRGQWHGHSTLTECRVTRSCSSKFKFIRFLFW